MFDDNDPRGTHGQAPVTSAAVGVMRSVWAVDHALRHLSRAMESNLGITGPQRLVLRIVGGTPGISAGDLAGALHLDASTLTGHMQRLEDLGLLERRASSDDGRRVQVFLTVRGRRLDVKMPGTFEAAVEAALIDTPPDAAASVSEFLARLVDEINAQATAIEKPKPRARRTHR